MRILLTIVLILSAAALDPTPDRPTPPINYIEGCAQYDGVNSCGDCGFNYEKTEDSKCVLKAERSKDCCLQVGPKGKCLKCQNGLQLNTVTGRCQDRKILGCINQTIAGCSHCGNFYHLDGTQCYKMVKFCKKQVREVCTLCDNDATLVKDVCIPNLPCVEPFAMIQGKCDVKYCNILFEFGCAECDKGFKLTANYSCVPETIIGCSVYANDNACLKCQQNWTKVDDKTCQQNGCAHLQGRNCTKCVDYGGFILDSILKICTVDNCQLTNSDGCILCDQGLFPSKKGCGNITVVQQTMCEACGNDSYYSHKLGHCAKMPNGCVAVLNQVCVACDNNNDLNPITKQCEPSQKQFGCELTEGVCTKCKLPMYTYDPVKKNCVLEGCLKYNPAGTGCDQCLKQFEIAPDSSCTFPNCKAVRYNSCLGCNDGYQYNKNFDCVYKQVNCAVFSVNMECEKCKNGFKYDQDQKKCVAAQAA